MNRSDVWAFACVFFYFLAGRLPFREPTNYLIERKSKREYTFPEGFDPTGRDLVEKLLVFSSLPNLSLAVYLIDVLLDQVNDPTQRLTAPNT